MKLRHIKMRKIVRKIYGFRRSHQTCSIKKGFLNNTHSYHREKLQQQFNTRTCKENLWDAFDHS